MQSILNNINNIFETTINDIYNKTKIRNNKITIHDILLYKFKYSELTKTKQNVVSEINYNNNTIIN